MGIDVYQIVTERIVKQLESGTIPWKKPWQSGTGFAVSHNDGKKYTLLNQMLLGFEPGEYATYKQIMEEGGTIKDPKDFRIVCTWLGNTPKKEKIIDLGTGEEVEEDQEEKIAQKRKYPPKLVYHRVYNILTQVEGVSPKYFKEIEHSNLKPDEKAEDVIRNYVERSKVTYEVRESNSAYYSPATDTVVVPLLSQYKEVSEFYSTVFHELGHSTGHKSRLNRFTDETKFGDKNYSVEELVAEMVSAIMVSICGLETEGSFQNSAAYIAGWLKALKNDRKLFVSAATKGEKAFHLILGDRVEEEKGE